MYRIGSGALPPGLVLGLSGRIMGTPTRAARHDFTIRVAKGPTDFRESVGEPMTVKD